MSESEIKKTQGARRLTNEEIRQQREDFIAKRNWEVAVETKVRQMLANRSMVVAETDFGKLIIISEKP